jgi:hypothetical protein
MKEREKIEKLPEHGFFPGLHGFFKLLEDMENNKETQMVVSGELEGPFGSKAVYGYTVRLGIDPGDLYLRRKFPCINTLQMEEKKKVR